MHFVISREKLLQPLQVAGGVVERRQTMPILANMLLSLDGEELSLTGTDLEVELISRVLVDEVKAPGKTTLSASKLLQICRSLPMEAELEFQQVDNRVSVRSGRSRFALASRSADDFPIIEDSPKSFTVSVSQAKLAELIAHTSFAMAQQDVRYYLNGMLFEVAPTYLRVVATDGHRMAMETHAMENDIKEAKQLILPRKGITELSRLLTADDDVTLTFGDNHIRAQTTAFTFTSKLIDGRYPDYERVVPKSDNLKVKAETGPMRAAFARAAILSNEKFHSVRITVLPGEIQVRASNQEQEEVEETLPVEFTGEKLELGFNVNYLIDVLNVVEAENLTFGLSDANSSALIEGDDDSNAVYVVMPMRI